MKKTTLFVVFSALTLSGFAQRAMSPGKKITSMPLYKSNPSTLMVADTLWGIFGSNISGPATPQLVGSANGGWTSGHNGYGDIGKAQAFQVTSPYSVVGCIFWFAGLNVNSGNATSKMVAKLYDMNGTGTTSVGTGPCPGAAMAGTDVDILFSSIDTTAAGNNGFVIFNFPSPTNVTADYAVVLDLTPSAPGDTVGIITSDPASSPSTLIDMSFDQWNDNQWYSYLSAANWTVDEDMAIFPIINTGSGVEELSFINGVKLYQNYPNPSNGVTTVSFELEQNAKDVKLFIHDLTGKQVKEIDLGSQTQGKHDVVLDANSLAQEAYYFSIQADRSRLAKQMTIVK